TMAEAGAVGAQADGTLASAPAWPVSGPIDVVGAGDAVTANLAAATAAGADLGEALELAWPPRTSSSSNSERRAPRVLSNWPGCWDTRDALQKSSPPAGALPSRLRVEHQRRQGSAGPLRVHAATDGGSVPDCRVRDEQRSCGDRRRCRFRARRGTE